jgi:hypothetical protein
MNGDEQGQRKQKSNEREHRINQSKSQLRSKHRKE